jgi:pimeloyl-ACP methyl ester carboxylesterase
VTELTELLHCPIDSIASPIPVEMVRLCDARHRYVHLHATDGDVVHANIHTQLLVLLLALFAAGCSDNDKKDADNDGEGESPARGTLLQNPPELVATVSASDLLGDLSTPINLVLLEQAGSPVCDIAVHRINYATVGGAGEYTTANGTLMVPAGSDARCHGARPIILYAHGTSAERSFNIANLADEENAEGLFLAAFFAAHGYIVVAPDYTGYGSSTLPYHPYLNADAQAADMIDALAAARSALPATSAPDTTDSGSLYVTGYSQGGYVAMATQRAMQAAGMTVTASAPMSGPYALSAFADAVFFGRVNGGAQVFTTFLITGYQRAYGDIYASASDVFEPQYADSIESVLPSSKPRSQLYADGDLPESALFDPVPPDPVFTDITPATTPVELAAVFARGFATDHLIRNSYRLSYLLDAQANPDGAWPQATTGEPPVSPGLPLRQALKRNDLRNWTPSSPTLLCGGKADPTVFWLNTEAMQVYWTTHVPTGPVTVLDVDSAGTGVDDPYGPVKERFATARDLVAAAAVAGGATDGGAEAVTEVYHAGLVAPFCMEAVRAFFAAN